MLDQITTVAALEAILRRPLLCAGEDPTQYDQLRKMLIDEIRPATAAEYLLANDIAEAEWELLRLHGFKAAMINVHMLVALKQYVRESGDRINRADPLDTILKLFRATIAGDRKARTELEKLLEKMKLSLSDVAATREYRAYRPLASHWTRPKACQSRRVRRGGLCQCGSVEFS